MSYFTKRSGRIVAATLAGALALTMTPIVGLVGIASAADALPPLADPIGTGNVCEGMPNSEPFTDVSDTDPGRNHIICLVQTGLTKGTTPTTYSPNNSITRRQMALFIKREIDLANKLELKPLTDLPAYDGVPDFTDIGNESAEVKTAVGQLNQAGVVGGFPDGTYRPAAPVSRRQMAAFVNRTQKFLTGTAFPDNGNYFNDDNGDSGEPNLDAVAGAGIFQGDGAGNVNPGGNLTRRQMAFVLTRHLQVLFEQGNIGPAFTPTANADFGVTPAATTLNDLSNPADDPAVGYTFTGLDPTKTYDIDLYPCGVDGDGSPILANGSRYPALSGDSTSGVFTFEDWNFDLAPDYDGGQTANGTAEIASIGFTPVNDDHKYDVSPASDGTLLVRVSSDDADCAVPVLWQDAGTDDDILNLSAPRDSYNDPAEQFAVGSAAVWSMGEAPTGTNYSGEVLFVDKDAKYFILDDGFKYFYGSTGDTAYYDGAEFQGDISMTAFESYLNPGDFLDYCLDTCVAYSRTAENRFQIEDDTPGNPSGLTATVIDAPASTPDADTDVDDLKFSWSAPASPDGDIDEYCVDAYLVNADGTLTYTDGWCTDEVNTGGTGDAPTTLTVVDHGLADGTYKFDVYADSETDDSGGPSLLSAAVPVGAPADTVRPTITDARVTTDAGLQDRFDAGDVAKLTFSEDMNASTATTGQFVLTDGDGDTFTIDCAVNATCVLSADASANADRVLTITITTTPTDSNVAGNGVLNMPATITTTNAAVKDEAGNVVNLATSADVIVDKEA